MLLLLTASIHVYYIPYGDSVEVIFNYSIPLDRLSYRKVDGSYVGRYRFEMEVFRNSSLYTSVIKSFYETVDTMPPPRITRSKYFSMIFEPGKYDFDIRIVDEISRSLIDSDRVHLNLELKGDIQVGNLITVFPNKDMDFDPRREFTESDSTLYVRIPIFSRIDDTILVKVELSAWRGRDEVSQFTYALRKGYNEIPLDYDISNLKFDQYELIIDIIHRGKRVARRKLKFSRVGYLTLTDKEREDLVAVLEYVYPGEFVRYLKKYGKFERAWEEFWKDRDPTPNTRQNEAKEQFLQRFKYALYNFSRYGRITDMGRVYIKYGPPDYIVKEEFALEGHSYQIWVYETLNKRFLFVDKYGTGDYELVPPGYYDYY